MQEKYPFAPEFLFRIIVNMLFQNNTKRIIMKIYQYNYISVISLQCRRILGERNLVRVRNIVVVAIFDFMTVEDWGE